MNARQLYVALLQEARSRQLAQDAEAVRQLEQLFARTAENLRADILATPRGILQGRYERDLLASLERNLAAFRTEYKALLDTNISAMAGIAADREQQLVTKLVIAQSPESLPYLERVRFMGEPVFGDVPRRVVEKLYARTYRDGLGLSKRLYNLSDDASKKLTQTMMEGFLRQESARKLAARIAPVLEETGVDNVRFKALRIARTEINNAFREGHRESITAPDGSLQPWATAIGWRLSPAHPRPDICDTWASDDPDGVGAGNYLPGNLPIGHPNCLCYTVTILAALPDQQFVSRIPQPELVPASQLRYYGFSL